MIFILHPGHLTRLFQIENDTPKIDFFCFLWRDEESRTDGAVCCAVKGQREISDL